MLSRLVDNVEERGLVLLNLHGIYLPEADIINLFSNNAKLGNLRLVLTDREDQTKCETVIDVIEKISFDSPNLEQVVGKFTKTDTVIIKSLTGLLQLFPVVSVARWLHHLCGEVCGVVGVVHSEGVDEEVLDQISRLATSFISIQPYSGDTNLCSIIHRKPGGKIQRSKELFRINSGVLKVEKFTVKENIEPEEDQIVESLTTFKIGTSSIEEKTKQELVLPFFTADQKKGAEGEVRIPGVKNKIYYEPDSGDDWDDEDPDEDLDL